MAPSQLDAIGYCHGIIGGRITLDVSFTVPVGGLSIGGALDFDGTEMYNGGLIVYADGREVPFS